MSISTLPLFESTLESLPLLGRGKVRDIYAVGEDKLLIVTTDRLSASISKLNLSRSTAMRYATHLGYNTFQKRKPYRT